MYFTAYHNIPVGEMNGDVSRSLLKHSKDSAPQPLPSPGPRGPGAAQRESPPRHKNGAQAANGDNAPKSKPARLSYTNEYNNHTQPVRPPLHSKLCMTTEPPAPLQGVTGVLY